MVAVFLLLNAIVVVVGLVTAVGEPIIVHRWLVTLLGAGGPGDVALAAFLAFPLLVLGLSGFETGVSMMPLVHADGGDDHARLESRIAHTRRLLTVAAVIMSGYLITTSFITTVLVPPAAVEEGGAAYGRALAYVAHELLGAGSAPSTTSARSSSCGSPARRRWPGWSTSSPVTCPGTGWRRSGPARSGRWCWSTPPCRS
jgi:hypothetical protein